VSLIVWCAREHAREPYISSIIYGGEELHDWHTAVPSFHLEMYTDKTRGHIKQALLALHLHHKEEESGLRIMVKPQKGVFAGRNYSAGKLRLVPASPTIMLAPATAPTPAGAIELGVVMQHPTTGKDMVAYILRFVVLPGGKAPPCVTPYWFVATVDSEEKANLDIQFITVAVKDSVFIVTKGPKAVSWNEEVKIRIPVFNLKNSVQAGDELLVFKSVKPKYVSAVTVLPPAKRSKT
jgi:hypothetical protein